MLAKNNEELKNVTIKIINLQHRGDRRKDAISELRKIGLNRFDSIFFNAKYVSENGALGCALSHAMALSEFLYNSTDEFALILEDDFYFTRPEATIDIINKLKYSQNMWDVFMLGHNQAIPIENSSLAGIVKVINAQTCSGYMVSKRYAPHLIKVFFESAWSLEKYDALPNPNKRVAKQYFCCDIHWKHLQIQDRFLAVFPALIKQKPSFSDIEKRDVNYGV